MKILNLSEEQINYLREIGNIAGGNAASRLSDIIHRRCMINIPEIISLRCQEIINTYDLNSGFVVAIQIKITGDIPALMLVITKRVDARKLVEHMTKTSKGVTGKDFTFTAQFALKQLGEILTRSFSESISQFLKAKSEFAMPEIIIDTWTTALNTISKQFSSEEELLVIHSNFFDTEKTFEGKFMYILNNESQELILNRLNLLLKGE